MAVDVVSLLREGQCNTSRISYAVVGVCGNVPFRDYATRGKNCFEIIIGFVNVYESFCKCDRTINVYRAIYPAWLRLFYVRV